MSNQNLNILFMVLIVVGMTLVSANSYRVGKQRGVREGYHRGRAVNRQEFWQE